MYKYLIGERGPRLRGSYQSLQGKQKQKSPQSKHRIPGRATVMHVSAGTVMDHHQEARVASSGWENRYYDVTVTIHTTAWLKCKQDRLNMDPVYLLLLSLVSCLVGASNDPCGRNQSTDIHIIGFFPCTHPNDTRGTPVDNCDGIDRIPIMKLALEEINERCDVLPGYRLVVDYANSAVSARGCG